MRIEVWMEVDFRNVSQGLAEDRFERPFIDLVMKRDGERLSATGQKLPADFDVAGFLVDFFKTELCEDFENVLPGESLTVMHTGGTSRFPRRRGDCFNNPVSTLLVRTHQTALTHQRDNVGQIDGSQLVLSLNRLTD